MKNYIICILIISFSFSYSQKKKNGNIYVEHPAIDVVNKLYSAINNQDYELMDQLISDDYKGVNGSQMNKDAEPQTKSEFINQVKSNFTNARYVSVKQYENSYPDAVEYKESSSDGYTWVYNWEYWTSVGGTTGIDYSQPRHVQYVVSSENKIVFSRVYINASPYTQTYVSQRELEDGDIYSHHPNINTVRKAIKAIHYMDIDNYYVDFSENAVFTGFSQNWGDDPLSLDENKESSLEFIKLYNINSLDNVWIRYYDFDRQNGVVQSWWRASFTRKLDNKEIVMPLMFNHTFNDDGKMIRQQLLWNPGKLN